MTDPSSGPRWLWHGVYAAVIALLCASVYFAAKSVDYTWRWDRVPAYILAYESTDLITPYTGIASVPGDGSVVVESTVDTRDQVRFEQLDEVLVGDGDFVFEGDAVGAREGWALGPLSWGLIVTLKISLLALVCSILIGVIAGLGRVSSNPAASALAATYVEIIRGTPLLVQIFVAYYFFGTVFGLSAFAMGTAALAVFTGAYVAEIVRAGIESIPEGQMEAARSLGMSYPQAMRHVILPQALHTTLPPMAGQLINLIKDSSLVSVIAITDLTKAGREVVNSTFSPFEVWFTVAAMYLLITGSLSYAINRLEKRMGTAA